MLMNDAQRKQFGEDNHDLIYKFLQKKGLSIDEFYDIVAIGYCHALKKYDPEKGKFSTIAYRCMEHELYHEYKKRYDQLNTKINYETTSYDFAMESEECTGTILDIIPDEKGMHMYEDAEYYIMLKDFSATLTEDYKKLLYLLVAGKKGREIAKELNISPSAVSQNIKRLGEKYKAFFN